MNRLDKDPQTVFGENHNLSEAELEEVRRRGKFNASMKTYSMIIEKLGRQANRGELSLEVNTLATWDKLNGNATKETYTKNANDQKRERKANAIKAKSTTSGMSTLTVNTVSDSKPRVSPCESCGLFHVSTPKCPLVKDGKLRIGGLHKIQVYEKNTCRWQINHEHFLEKEIQTIRIA